MLSSEDLESLIASKKLEIEEEKVQLGLVPRLNDSVSLHTNFYNSPLHMSHLAATCCIGPRLVCDGCY